MKSSEALAFPTIAEPAHVQQTAAAQAKAARRRQKAVVHISRCTILPSESLPLHDASASVTAVPTPNGICDTLQVFSYVAQQDFEVPPSRIAEVPLFGADVVKAAPESDNEEHGEDEDGPGSPAAGPQTTRKRRRPRSWEGRRVRYSTTITNPAVGSGGVLYASVPLPEYQNLVCLLVPLPDEGEAPAGSSSTNSMPLVHAVAEATALTRPLLELKSDVPTVGSSEAGPNVRHDGQSIASGWRTLAAQSFSGIKKGDWKNLDAMETEDAEAPLVRFQKPQAYPGHVGPEDTTADITKRKKKVQKNPPPPPAKAQAASASTTSSSATPPPKANVPSSEPKEQPADAPPPPPPPPPAEEPEGAVEDDLPRHAAKAIEELVQQHPGPHRPTMQLSQLEKLVLKGLPSYALMLAKFKNAATKAEANRWFRESREAFRQWLSQQGYIVDPAGLVCF